MTKQVKPDNADRTATAAAMSSDSARALPDARQFLPALGLDRVALDGWIRSLPPDLLSRIQAASVVRDFRAGEILFHKGEEVDGLYFIESGEVRCSTLNEHGQEHVLYLFEAGGCVGLLSSLDNEPSLTTCRAFRDTRTRLVRHADLQAMLAAEPRFYKHIADLLMRWVRGLVILIEDYAALGVRARLAKRLLQMGYLYGSSEADGILIPLKLSQDELALLLGATRQSIHQQFSDFRKRGWIALRDGHILMRDTAALADCVSGKDTD